jgi:polysaccharide pyruvyl transferase WcaK-like protein
MREIRDICRSYGVRLVVNISIDGYGAVHDAIRGIPGGFGRVCHTIAHLKNLGIPIEVQCTVSSANVYNLPRLLEFVRELRVPIIFRKATEIARLGNEESMQKVLLSQDERSYFADFLDSPTTRFASNSAPRRAFYKDLARRLVDYSKRRAPCYYQSEGVLLSAHGELFHCSISTQSLGNARRQSARDLYFGREAQEIRRQLLSRTCPGCVHDQAGAWSPARLILETDLAYRALSAAQRVVTGITYTTIGVGLALRMAIGNVSAPKAAVAPSKLPSQAQQGGQGRAVLIGCYGGEHVGDAAILGGVLHRLVNERGVQKAVVLSIRPHRTSRWLTAIDPPLPTEVALYSPQTLHTELAHANQLVLAGGPIMELPSLLRKHALAVNVARTRGIPILIESCGLGPFKTTIGTTFARHLLSSSDDVTLRTRAAVDTAARLGVAAKYRPDPAFDFLKLKYSSGDSRASSSAYDSALQRRSRAPRLALNLRPLWSRYAARGISEDSVRSTERWMIRQVADALSALHNRLGALEVVTIPLNADQYGQSDFGPHYALERALDGRLDIRHIERELDPLTLAGEFAVSDAVLCMRFHAAVFALGTNRPCIAVDYSIGRPGKVSELMTDAGHSQLVTRVDELTSSWLVDRLLRALQAAGREESAGPRESSR